MEEVGLFDEVRVVKPKPGSGTLISDEVQLAQIELTEASVAFVNAIAKAATPESLRMRRRRRSLRSNWSICSSLETAVI